MIESAKIRLNPHSAPAYGNLVLYLARSNKPEAAITAAAEASRRGLASPRMHWGLGLAHLGQGNVAPARQEFEQIGGTGGKGDFQIMTAMFTNLNDDERAAPCRHCPHGHRQEERRDLLITLIGNAAVDPGFRELFLKNPLETADDYGFRLTLTGPTKNKLVSPNLGGNYCVSCNG